MEDFLFCNMGEKIACLSDLVGKGPADGCEGVLCFWSWVPEPKKEPSCLRRTCFKLAVQKRRLTVELRCWQAGRCEGEILKLS